ncbi:hypothetical protein H6P81_003274 [Aristolochia fimbriata]|uniref:Uncharacterized protein n=1 Tax=Aristolochia fimbriata TaxID=158543 RepID=A0AAV7FD72_ARIFI|nr:hypothetical protein H6P81_003274 [Aristolochia fimbriata]
MDIVKGTGEHSYANNSSMQRVVMAKVKHIVDEAISGLYSSMLPESLAIGDLGCSAGPNTLALISQIIDAIDLESRNLTRHPPELVFYLNDLHGNDFNSVFQSLPAFHEKLITEKGEGFRACYVGAMPGSFYGRLFPKTSLHFIHSSYSLHWLSQVPPELTSTLNKGNVHLTEASSPLVIQAYLEQYKRDFHLFLRSRSEELVSGGRMVLTLVGRSTADPSCVDGNRVWEQLGQALYHLAIYRRCT